MQMVHWVYISEDEQGVLKSGLSADFGKSWSGLKSGEKIIYLRAFSTPFDAAAHKHLLDDLSQSSVKFLISKDKEKTKILLRVALSLIQ